MKITAAKTGEQDHRHQALPVGSVLRRLSVLLLFGGLPSIVLIGCTGASIPPEPMTQSTARPTEVSNARPTSTTTNSGGSQPTQQMTADEVIITLSNNSIARYRVQEQLARFNFPNDAVGETSEVEGVISLDGEGTVLSDSSKITVDLRTLRSDSNRRDGFLRDRSLESNRFPMAEFIVKEIPGLTWPLPGDGSTLKFQMVGDMTLHGVTRPLSWNVSAVFNQDSVSGTAMTSFTFNEFSIDVPRVSSVLSVEDNIRLELDFNATLDTAKSGE